jgi:DNA invertase Pin-like site-specific DNA recombinase
MKMLNVAAYCRVSTDHEDQANSLVSQKLYFENFIKNKDDWKLVGLFADEGLTGTSTKKRDRFNAMVDLALRGKIDLIITKDVSRFARNTVDLLNTTRNLTARGVGVLFINDSIDTRVLEGELRLSIMAVFAQEESRKVSERTKWGIKQAAERGYVFGKGFYGYHLNKGVLTVNSEEAEIVCRIYREFVHDRKGIPMMVREFNNGKVPCGNTNKWTIERISRILRDERYMGDLIQRKTHIENHLTHKRVDSVPEEMIVLKNHHEPIIDKKLFDAAQQEINRRTELLSNKSCHSNRYWASGLVRCGCCGSPATSRTKYNKDGTTVRFWSCSRNSREKRRFSGCDSNLINDSALLECVRVAMREVSFDRGAILNALKSRVDSVQQVAPADTKYIETKIENLQKKIQRVIDLYLEESISKEEMSRQKQLYSDEIVHLTSEAERVGVEDEIRRKNLMNTVGIIDRIATIIEQGDITPTAYSHILEKVVLFNKRGVEVYFKHVEVPIRLSYKTSGKGPRYRVVCMLQ